MAIDLKEAMVIIKSGEWMHLRCFTADVIKNKGGKILTFLKCRIARRQTLEENFSAVTGSTSITRSANHNYHFTVNLELENGEIRKVHPILITHLNNVPVL